MCTHIDPQKVLQICPGKYGYTEEVAPDLYKMLHCVRAAFREDMMPEIVWEVLVFSLSLRVFYCLQLPSPPDPTTLVFWGSMSLSLTMNLPLLKVTMSTTSVFYPLSLAGAWPPSCSPAPTSGSSFPAPLTEKVRWALLKNDGIES